MSDRSQTDPGEIAAGGPATPEELPDAEYAKGRTLTETRENLKESIEIIIEANHELTWLEIGSDAIREELLVAA
ncbi:MAG: hypothetical protein KAT13_03170 [Methanosarcinales archaeon]|nr:hypothetical protein [Methanosarcinales archaeon]